MPKVSVIMGVYNIENITYLKKSIYSILNQSFKDFEFIICDDGSNNGTYDEVKKIINDDKRCKLIKNKENCGLGQTLNNCIEIASGEYIARMDADDISLEDRLLKQVKYLDEHPNIAVLGTQGYFIDENGKRYKKFNRKKYVTLDDSIRNSCLIHPSTVIRRNVLNEVGNYTVNKMTTRAEDYDLWCKILAAGYEVENLEQYLFEYRETLESYKKRKFRHRIEEYELKKLWIKKASRKKTNLIYAYKPLIVGLLPNFIMIRRNIK